MSELGQKLTIKGMAHHVRFALVSRRKYEHCTGGSSLGEFAGAETFSVLTRAYRNPDQAGINILTH
jgi:hypothetical protein